MHRPNPVQSIAQQRQHFSPQSLPPVQSVLGQPGAVAEQSEDLAQEIYVRLIAGEYRDAAYTADLDRESMQSLAKTAHAAARAYFEERSKKE